MNKIFRTALAAACLLASSFAAHAQLSAGHILLTGNIGYNNSKDGNGTTRVIRNNAIISPQIGYLAADNLAVGVLGTYNISSDKPEDTNVQTSVSDIMGGAFVRYYRPTGEHAAFFGQLDAQVGARNIKTKTGGSTDGDPIKYNLATAAIRPGFTYFATDHLGIELLLGGLQMTRTRLRDLPAGADEKNNTDTSLDARIALRDLTVGLTYYLGGN